MLLLTVEKIRVTIVTTEIRIQRYLETKDIINLTIITVRVTSRVVCRCYPPPSAKAPSGKKRQVNLLSIIAGARRMNPSHIPSAIA